VKAAFHSVPDRGWRPTLLGRCATRVWAWATGLGLFPDYLVTLLVTERQSHRLRAHVLVAATYQGQRYLVSMLGEGSNWVQDARTTGAAALIKRGRRHPGHADRDSARPTRANPEGLVPDRHERPPPPPCGLQLSRCIV